MALALRAPTLLHPGLLPPSAGPLAEFLDLRPAALTSLALPANVGGEVLLCQLVAEATAAGAAPVWVDGGRGPDCHRLAEAYERAGLPAAEGLSRLRLARGFTAHQLQALVEAHLPREVDGETGLVLAANLPDLYAGEEVTPPEGRILLARALSALQAIARRQRVTVVATSTRPEWRVLQPALAGVFDAFPDAQVEANAGEDALAARFPRTGEVRVRERAGKRQRNLLMYGLEVAYG